MIYLFFVFVVGVIPFKKKNFSATNLQEREVLSVKTLAVFCLCSVLTVLAEQNRKKHHDCTCLTLFLLSRWSFRNKLKEKITK